MMITVHPYKPGEPSTSLADVLIAEDITTELFFATRVCSGDHEQNIQSDAKWDGPLIDSLLVLICIQFLRKPQKKVQRAQLGFDALQERCTTDETRARRRHVS